MFESSRDPGKTFEFNIIYTPGTVRYLSFFVWSLLKWSDATFRLVSNSCLPPERRFLQQLSRQDCRLSFWAIPSKTRMPHGHALNYVQALTRGDYFCFMDSDIFATGYFLDGMTSSLERCGGAFSGSPIWVKRSEEAMPVGFRHMTGTFNRSEKGTCLGSTYVAVYDNCSLTSVMQSSGIGFEEYRWTELPSPVQQELANLDLVKDTYDTGKVLNLLLLSQGKELTYLDLPSLCHVGGTSFQVHYDTRPLNTKAKILNRLTRSRFRTPIESIRRRRSAARYRKRYRDAPEAEYSLNATQRSLQRNPARQYVLRLLNALFQGIPAPPPPVTGDEEIDQRLLDARSMIVTLFEEYRNEIGQGLEKTAHW